MNAEELNSLRISGQPHLLVHVLPEEVFAAERIPGSLNACVYEMGFVDRLRELSPDPHTVIVVYGAGAGSMDAEQALAKLVSAGFLNVMSLKDGLDAWRAAGFPVEGHGRLPADPVIDGIYQVDTAGSVIRWTGRNLFNHHHGTVGLLAGEIHVSHGRLVSACFEIDLTSVLCEDLTDPAWNRMLIRHLQDSDFFDIRSHPVARFVVDSAEALPGATPGTPNFLLRGALTLRGVTRELGFPAVIASADGTRVTGQAQVEIDRTDFGSIYGSSRFFRFLGKHVVNDHIQLHLKIHADRP